MHQRRLYWHGFLLLLVAFLLGFGAVGAPHPHKWMVAHVSTMLGSVVALAAAAAWPHVRLSAGQESWAFRLLIAASYVGTFLNIFGAATNMPGPATSPGVDPTPFQGAVLVLSLLVIVPGFIGGTALMLKGMGGSPKGKA